MRLCEILEMKNIDKGTTIQVHNSEEKKIFFLKRGIIKIVDTPNDIVKYIVQKGNIFGELSLFDDQAANEEKAIALEDCIICYIEAERMEKIMRKHSSLKNEVLKIYGIRIQKLERRLRDLLYKDSSTRIREFIIHYIKEFGKSKNNRIIAKNLLSQKDISNLTNTSRQTVSNTMSTLRKQNIIDYDSQFISIPEKDL